MLTPLEEDFRLPAYLPYYRVVPALLVICTGYVCPAFELSDSDTYHR